MAETLLISAKDVKEFTALSGNLDVDKFVQWVKAAQDVHIEKLIGTKLLEKIKSEIDADTLSGNYLELVNKIKPCLVHYTMVEYLPYSAYTIANGGVYKHSSENSETVQKDEVDYLCGRALSMAENYKQRVIDFIMIDTSRFPEYNTNTSGDVYPNDQNYNAGWVM